jgi:hypothetical protein
MHSNVVNDLKLLEDIFKKASWLQHNRHEPLIGGPDCPALAEAYGERGRSCFIVFVHQKSDRTYGCRHEACFQENGEGGYSTRSLENVIRHQRYHHFYHQPFICVPSNGTRW